MVNQTGCDFMKSTSGIDCTLKSNSIVETHFVGNSYITVISEFVGDKVPLFIFDGKTLHAATEEDMQDFKQS
jgi:hypothetical protein